MNNLSHILIKRISIILCFAVYSITAHASTEIPAELSENIHKAYSSYNNEDYLNALESFKNILDNPLNFTSGVLKKIDQITLNRMIGRCHIRLHQFESGLSFMLKADSLLNELNVFFDPERPDDAKDISYAYFKTGNYEEGEEWGNKYALLLQQQRGLTSSDQAKAWLFLYQMNFVNGNHAKALKYAKKVLSANKPDELFNSEKDGVQFIIEVCDLLYHMNEVDNALTLASELEPLIAENMPESREHLRICNLLTMMKINDADEAQQYLDKALDIVIAMHAADDINNDTLVTLNNAAILHGEANPAEAIELFESLLDHFRSVGNQKNNLYAICLNQLSLLKGLDDPESPQNFKNAFHILAANRYSDISQILMIGINWIYCLSITGSMINEISDAAQEITHALNERLLASFKDLSESKRDIYWQQVRFWYQVMIPDLAYAFDSPDLWRLYYDCLLLSRGILLNSTISLATIVKESDDTELKALYKQYAGIDAISQDAKQRDRLSDALESRLLYESKKYGDYLAPFTTDCNCVSSALKNKEVAIEFVRYDINAGNNLLGSDSIAYEPDIRYLALLLDSSSSIPKAIELCHETELTDNSLKNIYHCVWEKLEPMLHGVNNIYFSPDGVLFSLPIEYALMPDGKFLWEQYDCHRLSSTRELVKSAVPSGSGFAIFGGMKYDMTVEEMIIDSEKYRDVTEEMVRERGTRDQLHGIRPLPGALRESKEIFNTANKCMSDIRLYKEKEATETAFKSISGTHKRFVHIATHGFYNSPASDAMDTELVDNYNNEESPQEREMSMMRHSGLLFSGVDNVRFDEEIPEGVEDGILDAYEISTLDMHGTDLVTLSACQTALGEVSGDGVFGLQRGFKKAGANSILMSLWNVDDDATQLFMTEFYKNLLEPDSGVTGDKHKALERARKAVMSHPEWNDYKYWGAFILLDALN